MAHLDTKAKHCPLCRRPLSRIWQPVTVYWRRTGGTTFRRHLMACLACGWVIRLNRLPQKYHLVVRRRKP